MAVILVVEDHPDLRAVVCRRFSRRGHTAIPASTGAEARAQAARRAPTIALLDLRLPDTDGLSLFAAIRREQPDVTGVIMTAYGSVPSAVDCLHAGISEYVEKPFDLDALVLLIERLDVTVTGPAGSTNPQIVVPSHRRLTFAMVRGIEDLSSITSFQAWGRAAGGAESTMRSWCSAAGVSPKAAEDFRRGLAATIAAAATGLLPRDLLGYGDARSIERFLARCGPLETGGVAWTPAEYCQKQRLLNHPSLVTEVIRLQLRGLIKSR